MDTVEKRDERAEALIMGEISGMVFLGYKMLFSGYKKLFLTFWKSKAARVGNNGRRPKKQPAVHKTGKAAQRSRTHRTSAQTTGATQEEASCTNNKEHQTTVTQEKAPKGSAKAAKEAAKAAHTTAKAALQEEHNQ